MHYFYRSRKRAKDCSNSLPDWCQNPSLKPKASYLKIALRPATKESRREKGRWSKIWSKVHYYFCQKSHKVMSLQYCNCWEYLVTKWVFEWSMKLIVIDWYQNMVFNFHLLIDWEACFHSKCSSSFYVWIMFENFGIFLSLRFYVKSFLRILEVQNQPFRLNQALNFDFL